MNNPFDCMAMHVWGFMAIHIKSPAFVDSCSSIGGIHAFQATVQDVKGMPILALQMVKQA